MNQDLSRRYIIVGARQRSNYIWSIGLFVSGVNFVASGLASYSHNNFLPWIHAENISFFPQGLTMCFYGLCACLLSFYITLTIVWNVGGGFNIFDKSKQMVRIFRWGFPGKNRRIDLTYNLNDINAVRVELKEGINPRRTIYLCVGPRQIPVTRVGQVMTLEAIEKMASDLAQFLQKDLLT